MGSTASFLELVHRVSQRGTEQFSKAYGSEVTPRQLVLLRALRDFPGASQATLVDATGVDRSTTAEVVTRLTARGLIKRRRANTDARAYAVNLTAEGVRVLADAEPVLTMIEASMLDALPELERQAFIAALERLVGRV